MKSTRVLTATLAALCLSLPASAQTTLQAWEFNTDGDLEGWTDNGDKLKQSGYNGVDVTGDEQVTGGAVVAVAIANDPWLTISGLSLDANLAGKVVMRFRVSDGLGGWLASPAGDVCVVNGSNVQGTSNTAPNTLVADGPDGWHLATWDVTDVTYSTITSLRVDPINWNSAPTISPEVQIDYIRVLATTNPPPAVELDPGDLLDPAYVLSNQWEWATDGNQDGWVAANATVDGITGGVVTLTSTTNDPIWDLNTALNVAVPPSGRVVVVIGVATAGGTASAAELFWRDDNGNFGGPRRIPTPVLPADNSPHELRFTFVNDIGGALQDLRFDPAVASGVTLGIDYIRIYTDPTTKVGWDSAPLTAGVQGGTGTWNTTAPNWVDSASANTTWPTASTANDDAIFDVLGGTVTITTGGITANDLWLLVDGYTITGDTLTLDGPISQVRVAGGATATVAAPLSRPGTTATDRLTVTGGGTLDLTGGGTIGRKWHFKTNASLSDGTFTSSGATASANSNGFVVFNDATLTIAGASVARTNGDADDALYIGSPAATEDFANATRPGHLVIDAGDLTVTGGRGLSIAFGGSNNATMTLNDGTVSANMLNVGWNSTGTLTVTGGTLTVNTATASGDALRHADSGAGTITIGGGEVQAGNVKNATNASGATALTLILDGGVLETERIWLSRGAAASTAVHSVITIFDGGTLRLPAAAPTDTTGVLIGDIVGATGSNGTLLNQVSIKSTGAIIDTNGRTATITAPLAEDGASTGGGLTKEGDGTLYLDGTATYTGTTSVATGFLGGNGTLTSNITVSPGAGLALRVTNPSGTPGTGWSDLETTGALTLPDPLVIRIDSAGTTPAPDVSATGLTILTAAGGVTGFNPATVTFDTTAFTGAGTWSARLAGKSLVLDYSVAGDDYSTWAAAQTWTYPGPNTGKADDFDGDGMTNEREYAFGLNPVSAASVSAITTGLSSGGTFTYSRRDPALSGRAYKVFTSTNLTTWLPDSNAIETPGPVTAGTQQVAVTVNVTPVNGKLFVKVVAQ